MSGNSLHSANNSVVALAATTKSTIIDDPTNAWYADAVASCYENGLMSGTSTTAMIIEALSDEQYKHETEIK